MKKCDIIIPVWNNLELTKNCMESLLKDNSGDYEVILIDNGSDEPTKKYLECLSQNNPNVKVIRNDVNLGFVKATNMGLKISTAPYVCLLNNDTIATSGWLDRLIDLAQSNEAFGLINPVGKGHIEHKMLPEEYGRLIFKNNKGKFIEVTAVGFCLLIKREVLEKIGFLDESFGIGGFDDFDYSRRAYRAGYKSVIALDSYVYHAVSSSFKLLDKREENFNKNEKIFFDKWEKFYRVLYVLSQPQKDQLFIHFNSALGLARSYNWVHFWVFGTKEIIDDLNEYIKNYRISEHQSLRKSYFLKHKFFLKGFFLLHLILSIFSRGLKKKGHKQFNLIITDDSEIASFLTKFKKVINIPICFEANNSKKIDQLNNSFFNKLDGIFAVNKKIFNTLKERKITSEIVLLPYGNEDSEVLKDNSKVVEFEKTWINRAKDIYNFIKNQKTVK